MDAVKTLRRCRTDARGAAAVEFAIVLPLLLMLVLGGLDWGYYFFVAQVTTNASREGARAGSLEPPAADPLPAAQAAVVNYLQRAGLDDTRATINPSVVGDAVRVEVIYPAGSLTGFIQVIVPANAQAASEMRWR